MSTLTVPVHFQHRKDLRRYLVFGILCQSDFNSVYPSYRNATAWMNQFHVLLSTYWLLFQEPEETSHLLLLTGDPTTIVQPAFPALESPPLHSSPQVRPSQDPLNLPNLSVSPPQFSPNVTTPNVHSNGGAIWKIWKISSLYFCSALLRFSIFFLQSN